MSVRGRARAREDPPSGEREDPPNAPSAKILGRSTRKTRREGDPPRSREARVRTRFRLTSFTPPPPSPGAPADASPSGRVHRLGAGGASPPGREPAAAAVVAGARPGRWTRRREGAGGAARGEARGTRAPSAETNGASGAARDIPTPGRGRAAREDGCRGGIVRGVAERTKCRSAAATNCNKVSRCTRTHTAVPVRIAVAPSRWRARHHSSGTVALKNARPPPRLRVRRPTPRRPSFFARHPRGRLRRPSG